jgi:hypothetical protein
VGGTLLQQQEIVAPTLGGIVCCVLFVRCSKSELLVVLKQPEGFDGPTTISLITDNANHLVLHWGTTKPGENC